MARRRRLCHHPQIQASVEGAGVACRRRPRLHPQIHASKEDVRMTRRRRGKSPAAPASLPDDDDMLREILLRLPTQPSALHRASAVCKRWRGLVTDPGFLRQLYAHHRKPPLLGIFERFHGGILFTPILDPPDRIPSQRFDLGRYSSGNPYRPLLDCRHGRVLIEDRPRDKVVVCDPITGEQYHVAIPPNLKFPKGVVLCPASDQGHSMPFKVALVSTYINGNRPHACVYSSETGLWGNLISTEAPCLIASNRPAVLFRNCLYWLSLNGGMLEFDLAEHSLSLILGPPVTNNIPYRNRHIILAEDGALGFATLSYPHFQMWRRNVNGHAVATWVPWKTIEMHTILKLPSPTDLEWVPLLGYDEDSDAVFLRVGLRVYMVQLKLMQSRKLHKICRTIDRYHPFRSFYTPGTAISGGSNEAETLHNA